MHGISLLCLMLLMFSLPGTQAQPQLWQPVHVKGQVNVDWYVQPMLRYANYITNPDLMAADKVTPDKASQYLYDRPRVLMQLYMFTGDVKWKNEAIAASKHYISHIGEDGFFSLVAKKDIKYLMPKGLHYYFQLTQDNEARKAIARIYRASLNWEPQYIGSGVFSTGFWTERNQAAALDAAVTYFELTNDESARERIEDILSTTTAMVETPENNWPQRYCPQHSFKSHEGGAEDDAVCSTWMLALLADPIWRYQQITKSDKARTLLQHFGQFILQFGTYTGTDKFAGQVLPKYLVVFDNPQLEELNPWNDMQHSCDGAALLGKALYLSDTVTTEAAATFHALLAPCKNKQARLKDNQPYWKVKPPRKFGWEYSTTSELPWLEHVISSGQQAH